jgi:ribosomal protein S18 acetylase RimI-like enzyme
MNHDAFFYRSSVSDSDREQVRRIVESSGFFSPYEVEVAVELVEERLTKGTRSGYYFLFAEQSGMVVGYICFGPIACTATSYEIYWVAAQRNFHRRGIGKELLQRSECAIAQSGGRRIYIETSLRKQYTPSRLFYEACGYRQEAILNDFYSPGDAKVIYVKECGETVGNSEKKWQITSAGIKNIRSQRTWPKIIIDTCHVIK